jgi:hypothetical protein
VKAGVNQLIKDHFGTEEVALVKQVQSLWSGYGKILRFKLPRHRPETIIAKEITFPEQSHHPRGWNTQISHERKVKSYEVESSWYTHYASLCNKRCRVPACHAVHSIDDSRYLLLEDLDASGYPLPRSALSGEESKVVLKWLAHFHATFMGVEPRGLWEVGTYWQLATRPEEWEAMPASPLKQQAREIDRLLNGGKYQTLVHGDAKVANFCFSKTMQEVAAVDFQYVGGGCGMKDVAYFLGSCLREDELEQYEAELLDYYFRQLESALKEHKNYEFELLEREWSSMYVWAWADFMRFLLGWMPDHQKIHAFSMKKVEEALQLLKSMKMSQHE